MDERLAFDVQIDRLLKKLRTKLGFFYRLNFFSIWGSKENSRECILIYYWLWWSLIYAHCSYIST